MNYIKSSELPAKEGYYWVKGRYINHIMPNPIGEEIYKIEGDQVICFCKWGKLRKDFIKDVEILAYCPIEKPQEPKE